MTNKRYRVGVDVGGTNTDICAIDEVTSELKVYKLPSSTKDQSRAVVEGIKSLAEKYGFALDEIDRFIHGTTVSTNAILEGRGAKTALITTEGFRDLLEIGRQKRPDLYDLQTDKPKVLITRDLRYEVKERIDYTGKIIRELDEAEVIEIIRKLKGLQIESLAVAFLNAYINPTNEQTVKRIAQEYLPDVYLSISSEISNQFREFERMCGTVLNSFIGPEVKKYLENLKSTLTKININKLYINHSNGGIMSLSEASQYPIKTSLSGPSAGVIGAQYVTGLIGYKNVLTIDIGGTSTDLSLIIDGKIDSSKDKNISGYPVRIPSVDIATIGAGGGSIAWVDSGGILKVGPQSAGAEPGPACYDRGGEEATITDARVVLGHLNNKELLNGQLPINSGNSFTAVEKLSKKINMDIYETAQGIITVGNSNIIKEIKKVTVEKGFNPNEFVLFAFGGAGPLHAAELMEELSIAKAIIPRTPGILAAYGLLVEDMRRDFVQTNVMDLGKIQFEDIEHEFQKLEKEAEAWFEFEAISPARRVCEYYLDMRYKGQNYEILVSYDKQKVKKIQDIIDEFNKAYKQLYSYSYDDEVQIINYGLSAIGYINKPKTIPSKYYGEDSSAAIRGERLVRDGQNRMKPYTLYDRDMLNNGNKLRGPAVIEQMDATTIIGENQIGVVDEYLNIVIEQEK